MKVLAMIETGAGEVDLAVQAAAVHETTEATASASRTMCTSWVMLVPPRVSLTMRLSLVEGVVENKKKVSGLMISSSWSSRFSRGLL